MPLVVNENILICVLGRILYIGPYLSLLYFFRRPLSCPALLPLNADYDDDQAFGTGYNESEEHGARTIGASSAYTRSLITRGTQGLRVSMCMCVHAWCASIVLLTPDLL